MSHSVRYQIRVRVQGELPPTWSTLLADLAVAAEPDETTLVSGELADQAALHGLLAAIRDLGLPLIAVETVAIPLRRLALSAEGATVLGAPIVLLTTVPDLSREHKAVIAMTIKAFIKKQPVLTYYALTFAISWGAILILVGPGGFLSTTRTSPSFALAGLASLLGPSLAVPGFSPSEDRRVSGR